MDIQQTAAWLSSCDNATILTHKNPDGDTLGAAFALCAALRGMDKHANVLCADPIPQKYSYMTEPYTPQDFEEQCVIAVDIADPALLGSLQDVYGARVDVCIDHHPSNRHYAKNTCLDPKAAATCESMAAILDLLKVETTSYIADCIFTGLSTDTGCFRYPNTRPQTHRIAAQMMDAGCDAATINRVMFETKSRVRMELERTLLSQMQYAADGRCAVVFAPRALTEQLGAVDSDYDGIAAITRRIEGVEVGVFCKEQADGTMKVSLRTSDAVDASKLCGKFGGGGHARAAGCTLHTDMQTAIATIIKAVEEALK